MIDQDTITVPQRRILNLLTIKGVTMDRFGFDRFYICHPVLTRKLVDMNIANSLIESGYVSIISSDSSRTTYVLSDEGRQALGVTA